MNSSAHAERTYRELGIRAEDIHRWIDGLFDAEGFAHFLRAGRTPGYDPYDHRKFRHCIEALQEAYREFDRAYTRDQIRAVFEMHVKDDYHGYLPRRADFENGTFVERYHESGTQREHDPILSTEELSEYFRTKHYSEAAARSTALGPGFYLRIVLPALVVLGLFIGTAFLAAVPAYREMMVSQKRILIRELTVAAATEISYEICGTDLR